MLTDFSLFSLPWRPSVHTMASIPANHGARSSRHWRRLDTFDQTRRVHCHFSQPCLLLFLLRPESDLANLRKHNDLLFWICPPSWTQNVTAATASESMVLVSRSGLDATGYHVHDNQCAANADAVDADDCAPGGQDTLAFIAKSIRDQDGMPPDLPLSSSYQYQAGLSILLTMFALT